MMTDITAIKEIKQDCYHCGESCDGHISGEGHSFCCEGCLQVYLLLNEHDLCQYYNLEARPGLKAKGKFTGSRFAYLDDPAAIKQLLRFSSDHQAHVFFYLPQVHCSSCIFLLENLHRINKGIASSRVDFHRKEVFIVYDPTLVSLREVAELLAFTGYEPEITLNETQRQPQPAFNRNRLYRIGIAGFCFSNIMMLSFPEYFSSGKIELAGLKATFTWLIFFLSLPVLLYSASVFFVSAWKGLRQGVLNIDGPIAVATAITFARSYYEIISGTGAGYLDSGTGIVFFMLIGRWFQDKTYGYLSFDRNYKSYFPLGVTVVRNGREQGIPVSELRKGEHIIVRNGEMIPADAILLKGEGHIDYSFISGEATLVSKPTGEMIYAGARQSGGAIELKVVNEASQSYITRLWNNETNDRKNNREPSFIHPWSRYFTLVLYSVAGATAIYWAFADPSKIGLAVTAVLIVACPCSLLLTATFTFGNMLRIFSRNRLYLKNAGIAERLSGINTIVLDKTGTITTGNEQKAEYIGEPLAEEVRHAVWELAAQSAHPLSRTICNYLSPAGRITSGIKNFREYEGRGITAVVNGLRIRLGSASFVAEEIPGLLFYASGTNVYLLVNGRHMGRFHIGNNYRKGIDEMASLLRNNYQLHILSGDNDNEAENLRRLFGNDLHMQFGQSPQDKLAYIKRLQQRGAKVLMLGDGLNDAGALLQADAGIAVTDNTAQFTPACDAILEGSRLHELPAMLSYAKKGRKVISIGFAISIMYNVAGISFAVQGLLSPMIAAILMPLSSITIVSLAMFISSREARRLHLSV